MASTTQTDPGDPATPPTRPRRRLFSKLIRSAALAAGEEVVASTLARPDNSHGVTSRVPKMALYGALVNTTVTHLLIESLRMLFRRQNKILQIVVTLLIAAPIQKLSHLLAVAYAHGERTFSRLRKTVGRSMLASLAMLAVFGSAAVAFAQIFLPQRTWPRFFQQMRFVLNVYDNMFIKRTMQKAERRIERRETRRRVYDNDYIRETESRRESPGSDGGRSGASTGSRAGRATGRESRAAYAAYAEAGNSQSDG